MTGTLSAEIEKFRLASVSTLYPQMPSNIQLALDKKKKNAGLQRLK